MSDYFSSSTNLTTNTPAQIVASSTKDRVVYLNAGGSILVGLSSTTCVLPLSGSGLLAIPLPAGEELWAVNPFNVSFPVLVTKSASNVSLCG